MGIVIGEGRRSRHDGTYLEVLEWILYDAGYDIAVRNFSRPADQIHNGARRFIEQGLAEFPDVLIIHYGINECRPPVVPWVLIRHLFHPYHGLSAASELYRKVVAKQLWRMVRSYQRYMAARVGQRTWRMSPDRFSRECLRLFEIARRQKMLVLVIDQNQPASRILQAIPGLDERCASYRRVQERVVAEFGDPDVRLVSAAKVVEEMGIDKALPDSLHFSAPAHRRLGEMLAAEVGPWLEAQGMQRVGTVGR